LQLRVDSAWQLIAVHVVGVLVSAADEIVLRLFYAEWADRSAALIRYLDVRHRLRLPILLYLVDRLDTTQIGVDRFR
jgi:hypothetical protein